MSFEELDFNERTEDLGAQEVLGFEVEEEDNESARLISMHDFSEFGDEAIDGGTYSFFE